MNSLLDLQTALRGDKTFLKKAYHTTPFKIADITEDKRQHTLKLMLMSSSPGILDGDEYHIKIEIEENCSLALQTQSYQRLFTMKTGASQLMEIYMAAGSSFSYLPHPSVPHTASHFVAKNKIHLSANCSLIWGEVLTCGRKLHGEQFRFSKYHSITEVFLNNRLIIKENLLLRPSVENVSAIGQFEGYTHQSSLLYLDEAAGVNALVTGLRECLLTHTDICFGVSALPVNGLIVRILGYRGEQLHDLQKKIAAFITDFTSKKAAAKQGTDAD